LEFEKASFFGGSRDPHLVPYSPLNSIPPSSAGDAASGCSLEAFIPALDRLIWCVIILAAVTSTRALLATFVTRSLKKELPSSLQFSSWEGPALLTVYVAICSASILAMISACQKWNAVGSVLFVFWPLLLMVSCVVMLIRNVVAKRSTYESFDAKVDPPRLRPGFAEMWKSLDRHGGFVPNFMRLREWFLATDARGWWRDDSSKQALVLRFLIGDYVGPAQFFGIWLMAKRILLSAAVVALDGRAGAIVCIVVQTFDMLFVIGFRPYVSQLTCTSECISTVTNWLAFLNLGLLLWPGTTPLQLGEATVFGLAIMGTCFAALSAGVEALMAMVIVIWNLVAGFGVCLGYTGACMVAVRITLLECCFGAAPGGTGDAEEGGPIFLTSIAADWADTPRKPSQGTDDVTQSMVWAPISPNGLPADAPSSSDPAALAAYYRQLADNYQLMSMSMKKQSNNGRTQSTPSLKSPVSMSTAPSAMYNTDSLGPDDGASDGASRAPGASSRGATRQLPSFTDPQGLRSSARELPLVSASFETLLRPQHDSPDPSIFSRRATPSAQSREITNGAPAGSIPPPLGGSSNRGPANTPSYISAGVGGVNTASIPTQSLSQRLASSSNAPVSALSSRRVIDVAPSADKWSRSPSPAKRATVRGLSQGSPRMFDNRDNPIFDASPSRQVASTSRADQLRDGIRRRAEALERDLSPASTRSLSPSSTRSPEYVRSSQMQVTPTPAMYDKDNDSRIRGTPPNVGSPMSAAYTPAGILPDPDNFRQEFMPRLGSQVELDMAGLRHPLLDSSPRSLPPPPSYQAPPPPPVISPTCRPPDCFV